MPRSLEPLRRLRRIRHALPVVLLCLLPLLALAGVLAPGVIAVQGAQQSAAAAGSAAAGSYTPVELSKRPLLVPRDYSPGFVPELLDLEQLFVGTRFRSDAGRRFTRLPSFPSLKGDVIVIDDLDMKIGKKIFDDVLDMSVVASTSNLDPEVWAVIPPLWPAGDGLQYDDFTGGTGLPAINPLIFFIPLVPEPGTGALLGLGLLVIALRQRGARRRQRAVAA
jgi:PEP-CTERM motif